MSKFECPVTTVISVENHPNADRLSIVKLDGLGYTCIANKLDDGTPRYTVGDIVVYIPSASILPEKLLQEMGFWDYTAGKGTLSGSNGDRVKPMKLRGVFSEGLLYPAGDGFFEIGDDAAEYLGITKYEPPIPVSMQGQMANMFGYTVNYDFERHESVPDIFYDGESISVTEKLHGTMAAMIYQRDLNNPEMFGSAGEFIIHSKGLGGQGLAFKNVPENKNNIYVRALSAYLDIVGFEDKIRSFGFTEGRVVIVGEIYGAGIQDLNYGETTPKFRVFDIQIGEDWLSTESMVYVSKILGLETVPVLYFGPYDHAEILKFRDGKTAIVNGQNIREGVVVRAETIKRHPTHGRKIAKFISPDYLLRKVKGGEATEYQ